MTITRRALLFVVVLLAKASEALPHPRAFYAFEQADIVLVTTNGRTWETIKDREGPVGRKYLSLDVFVRAHTHYHLHIPASNPDLALFYRDAVTAARHQLKDARSGR